MKNSKIPGLNAPFNLKGSVDRVEMMMLPGNVKKAGYRVEEKIIGIDKKMDIDERVFKNIDMKTETIGWNRLGKQKDLKLFGDVDKDKTLNIFDCDPFDRMRQAGIHDFLRFGREKVGKFITIKTVPTKETEEAVKLPWAERVEKLGYAVGLLKTPEQRLEIEKRRVELAKARVAERIALAKVTPPPVPVRRAVVDRAGRMVRRVMPPPALPISPAQKMSQMIGLSPTRVPMYPIYGMGGAGFRQMVTGEEPPVQPPIPYPAFRPGAQPGVPVQPIPSPQVIISPYSKRPVAYTRGPYRKRVVVTQPGVQYGVPQYVSQY